jgi:hypothetical protein
MSPVVLASVLALGAAGVLGLGVLKLIAPRRSSLPDYLELPAPSRDEPAES